MYWYKFLLHLSEVIDINLNFPALNGTFLWMEYFVFNGVLLLYDLAFTDYWISKIFESV